MEKIYAIHANETRSPIVGITRNPIKTLYKSYQYAREFHKKDCLITTWKNKWEMRPYYKNVIEFYRDYKHTGTFLGFEGRYIHRGWYFSEIKEY